VKSDSVAPAAYTAYTAYNDATITCSISAIRRRAADPVDAAARPARAIARTAVREAAAPSMVTAGALAIATNRAARLAASDCRLRLDAAAMAAGRGG